MKNRTPFGNPFGIFLIVLFALSGTAMAQKVASVAPAPQIKFEKTTHDFGNIPQGTPVTTTFTFKNAGKAPLVLSNVQASCGCTTPSYTKEPIAPGKTGTITATYNAAGAGQFNKSITVTSNAGEPVVLMLQGTVVAKEQGGSANPTIQPK
jgi:Protein of unknown function (DUF1573)